MNLSNATHPPQYLGRGNPDPDTDVIASSYHYDSFGNQVRREMGATHKLVCGCDILSQNSQSSRDHYDPDGNRVASHLSDPAPTPAAEFNLRNQIIRDHLFEYRYDLNGNLTHKYLRETCASSRAQDVHSPCLDESSSEATPSFLFSHDEDNKMTAAHNIPQSLSIAIRYDPLGRRFHTKTYLSSGSVPPVHIQWRAFDGDDAFADFTTGPIPDPDVIGSSPAPALANLYLHGPGVDEPLAWWSLWTDSSGSHRLKPVLLLADGLGSITGLTANADYPAAPKPVQGLASSYRYDSFGNQVQHCNAPAAETSAAAPFKLARLNPYRYAAREWLSLDWSPSSALGLSDNRARFYDPTLASFLQEDPLWNTNPYTYVGNNPVYQSDPSGEDAIVVNRGGSHLELYLYNPSDKTTSLTISHYPLNEKFKEMAHGTEAENKERKFSFSNLNENFDYLYITGLNEKAIVSWWNDLKQDKPKWSFTNNCTTMVKKALAAGGLENKYYSHQLVANIDPNYAFLDIRFAIMMHNYVSKLFGRDDLIIAAEFDTNGVQ